MFSVITKIYNMKTKGHILKELFAATGKLKKFFPLTTRDDSDYAENWPDPVQRHLQRLMGDHLISACTDDPVLVNCLYHSRMVLSAGGSFAHFARNAHRTVTTDLLV
jgi:hypothetical protein